MPGIVSETTTENKSADPIADEFAAAFDQISDAVGETKPTGDAAKTPEQIEAEKVAAEAAAKATADAAKTPEQIEAEKVAAEAAAKAEADKANSDLVQRLSTLIKGADPQAAAEAARMQAEQAAAAKAEADRAAQDVAPKLSPEELALVQQFEKDFPDVARAQAIVRRNEYNQLVRYVFKEVGSYFEEKFAPLASLVQNLAERTHVGDLKSVVPNYDTLDVAQLSAWVGKQPAYLKSAYDAVMKTGSAEEVKDLVSRFYAETGQKTTPSAPNSAAVADAAKKAEEAARIKKAAASLAPVADKRGAGAAAPPAGYDDAFEAATRELAAASGTDRFSR